MLRVRRTLIASVISCFAAARARNMSAATVSASGASASAAEPKTYDIPTVMLGGELPCKRILNGLWQTSGGWYTVDPKEAVANMVSLAHRGFTTFDGADHYGPAEQLMGATKEVLAADGSGVQGQYFSKWVPRPARVSREAAAAAIQRSLDRMRTPALDLLQFHWWDYAMEEEMVEALKHLMALKSAGKIKHLAVTNMDTKRMQVLVDGHGIPLVSNQVQFSVLDTRPAQRMGPWCAGKGIYLLTYGSLMGGFLSDKYLGAPDPGVGVGRSARGRPQLPTPSLGKYYDMLQAWGSSPAGKAAGGPWALFQELLRALRGVADVHGVSIATVAIRWVLEQQAVGGVIVGLRAGLVDHAEENARVFSFTLTTADHAAIAAVQAKGADLMAVIGDCGDEYR